MLRILFLLLYLTPIVCQCNLSHVCVFISFFALWFIWRISSFVHFKKGSEYFTRVTVLVLIPLMISLLQRLVSRSFLIRLRYSFFHSSPFIWWCLLSIAPSIFYISFSPIVLTFISGICLFPLFIISKVHFSIINSIPVSWLYICIFCIRVSNSFSFFVNRLMLFKYIKWFILSRDLASSEFCRHCLVSSRLQIVMVKVHLDSSTLLRQ